MRARTVAPFAVVAVILGAAAIAMSRSDRAAGSGPTEGASAHALSGPASHHEPDPSTAQAAPAHAAPLASSAVMGSENAETPGITWTAPADWEAVRNPNGMRLATYRVRGTATGEASVDISVARAGGSSDANIERWLGQFEADPTVRRSDTNISGLPVTLVDIRGTYRGGGMMPGPPPEPRPGWTLLAAIVATPAGAPYFFKVLGPASAVNQQREAFGALVQSFKPSS